MFTEALYKSCKTFFFSTKLRTNYLLKSGT